MAQHFGCPLICKRVEPRAQDGQGSSEFVRRIGGKFPLNAKALFETIKCLVYRLHKVANSLGILSTGRRTSACAGPILCACVDACSNVRNARRKMTTSMASNSSKI